MILLRMAKRTSSLTEDRPSLCIMLARWASTVLVLIFKATAISLLLLPSATN